MLESEYNVEFTDILSRFCEKENGKWKTIKLEDSEHYDVKDLDGYKKEFQTMQDEHFLIEQNETNREMLLTIRDIIMNCPIETQGNDALIYDRFWDMVEDISYG